MARLSDIPEPLRSHLAKLECPTFEHTPWAVGPAPAERRIAMVSTAGLHTRDDRPFAGMSGEYRVIPGGVAAGDLVMSHISSNFDRTGFAQDLNVVFPLDRLNELAREGVIGGVADRHYSFMGATDPKKMESAARELAARLEQDQVTGVLLVPV
ncbi:MAG: glycine/betaine/sarcosine/D-proline family reductase selenoprotein B [Proteobacteria bacterium]|nr:glycine/betaine/sarcosine/D-proline family reductase selenoprotein B [Pseudomonadota bacterium]MBU1740246.1 glycine/betaine/sarcosine/D-proline family reductase selenoprotein B [Pseudomonadota bacterium]